MAGRSSERELEDEIFSAVAIVVDLQLIQLLILRAEREARSLCRRDGRRRSEHENGSPWRRRGECVDVVHVESWAELDFRRVLMVGGTQSTGGQTSDEPSGDEGWHQPPASE